MTRIYADEAYFIIGTKLNDVPEALELLTLLDEIHENKEGVPSKNWVKVKTSNLQTAYREFEKEYVV